MGETSSQQYCERFQFLVSHKCTLCSSFNCFFLFLAMDSTQGCYTHQQFARSFISPAIRIDIFDQSINLLVFSPIIIDFEPLLVLLVLDEATLLIDYCMKLSQASHGVTFKVYKLDAHKITHTHNIVQVFVCVKRGVIILSKSSHNCSMCILFFIVYLEISFFFSRNAQSAPK